MLAQPQTPAHWIEWFVRLLAFVGGVATTIDGLNQHFRPIVFNLNPLVFVAMGTPTQFRDKAKATGEPTEKGDVLLAALPSALVFGPLDSVLLEDAKGD